MVTAIRPGRTSGMVIVHSTRQRLHPSTSAASSIDTGISSMNTRNTQITSGTLNTALTRASAQ
jgi:hypothetical protein